MGKWLRAVNPLIALRGMAEAMWSAQSMAFAFAISFLGGLPGTIWLVFNPAWFSDVINAQQAARGLTADDVALMASFSQTALPFLIGTGALFTAFVYGALAWVQWRQMTRWIPIVWLAFVVYGLLMMLVRQLSGSAVIVSVGPPWMYALSVACSFVTTVIAVASLRGALALHRLKREP